MLRKFAARLKGIEGAGPKIMAPLFVTFAITAWISYAYRPAFDYPLVPAEWTLALGALFLVVGVPFWLSAVGLFLAAWFRGGLETRGPFAVMPNPIYGSWIALIVPGISLVLGWWPVLLTSVVMFAAHRLFIREEDESLRQKFGKAYEEYRKRVLIKFL
jgi:protein-S-isoprenylcysteine O-methyltransferase Ste14